MSLDAPAAMNPEQQAIWQGTVHDLDTAGYRYRVDEHSLETYVLAVYNWRRARDLLQQSDILVQRGQAAVPNPALQVMTACAATINTFAGKYRLNWRQPGTAMRPAETPPGHATEAEACVTCGAVHEPRHCGGHSRKGTQCTKARGYRTDHPGYGNCAHHGGATPSGRKAADRERGQSAIFRLASRGEVEPMTDPLQAIARMAAERQAWADAVVAEVNRLGPLTGLDERGIERLRAMVPLMERMSDRAFTAAKDMASLDIDERLVAVQAQAIRAAQDWFERAMDAVVSALGHDPREPVTAQVVETTLRGIAA